VSAPVRGQARARSGPAGLTRTSIRNVADRYRAELDGPFDFLLVELPRCALDQLTEEAGCGPIDERSDGMPA
jgi:hypothetical protein